MALTAAARVCRITPCALFGAALLLGAGNVRAALLDDFLRAADEGQCIETVTYRLIKRDGVGDAAAIVRSAVRALAMRERQQRELGCTGDIAAQAIVAGADPNQVLEATAAGL